MIFDTIKNLLKDEITPQEFERYIKQIHYNESASRSNLVVLEVPNPLLRSWIATRYSDKIAHLFELKTGIRPVVEVVVKNRHTRPKESSEEITIQQSKGVKSTLLNPSHTFENFVAGPSNQFAYTAATSVADKPGRLYNPLFLYGGVGLGKTHLLQAIGNRLAAQGKSIIYVTIEQFLNDFTLHLRNQTMDRFREKYRGCDLLLIDDVQFLSNKLETQEEFFHTFNELQAAGRQIVMTADKHPKQIAGLEARLKSRFESGLIADIQPPELETKIAIIRKKCELDGIRLSPDIITYIATHMDENIRQIEGTIIRLNAYSSMVGQEITLDFAKNALRDQIKETQANITIDTIVEVIAREMNVKPSEIRSKSRSTNIVNARRMVIYLARTLTPNSMPIIAQYFGMKDHTAVSHSIKKINELLKQDANMQARIDELKAKIQSGTA
ncbi:MAG: chromosomal replication initiator protein DnaA [Campylobacterales bacterium]